LGALKGPQPNLAVLLFFTIFTAYAMLELFLPLYTKQIEQITPAPVRNDEESELQRPSRSGDDIRPAATTEAASVGNVLGTKVVIRQALQASIRAQEESLEAQRALLRLLVSQADEDEA
jgi:hypothetical protein